MIQSKFSKQPIFEYNFHPKFVVKVYQKCNLCCNMHKILNSTTNNNLHCASTGGRVAQIKKVIVLMTYFLLSDH